MLIYDFKGEYDYLKKFKKKKKFMDSFSILNGKYNKCEVELIYDKDFDFEFAYIKGTNKLVSSLHVKEV